MGRNALLLRLSNEEGFTSIGPYQLSFPFEVIQRRSWMVVSRPNSNTHKNVSRTLKCAMNFVEYDREKIETILKFGYPGQEPEEKMAYNDFELIDSPTPGRESNNIYPKIIKEAYQVYECTLDIDRINENPILRDSVSAHLLLNIDNILLKETWKKNLEGGGRCHSTHGPASGCRSTRNRCTPSFPRAPGPDNRT